MFLPETESLERRAYFFDAGLQFTCRQCGSCCTGAPGTVYVDAEEICAIAKFIALDPTEFVRSYLFPFKNSFSIREDPDGNCLFFRDKCTIYPVRPHQCRTFPFWFANLRSERRWARTAARCPGIGSGRHYSKLEILSSIRATMHI